MTFAPHVNLLDEKKIYILNILHSLHFSGLLMYLVVSLMVFSWLCDSTECEFPHVHIFQC